VPPDIVMYRVTTRAACEQISPYLRASPREPLKDEARRNPRQATGQLLLSYLHPVPVDMSATPYFVGSSSSHPRQPGTLVNFEMTGASVEIGNWLDRQARSERYPSTTAALQEFWGYTSFFPHLVTDPRLAIEVDGKYGAVIIEKVNTEVRKVADDFTYTPFDVQVAFFTATQPDGPPPPDPPHSFSYDGEGTMLRYGRSGVAVNISATPIHLGRMHLYSGGVSGDKPGYCATAGDSLGFTVEDRASEEAVRIDLAPWLAANPITGPAGNEQLMTDPVVTFEFAGKQHALVLEGIVVIRDGTAGTLEFMTGQLFRAR
jgi:hypothetical protein